MMASSDIAISRLRAQGINCPSTTVREAVSRMLALQAQDRPSSLWAIGLRSSGSKVADVEEAVASGSIVRTWLMRGTLHFTAAEDVRWLLQLVAPRIISKSKRRDEQLLLDTHVYYQSRDVLTKALDSHGQLSRSEIMAALEGKGITTTGQRGYHILRHLALQGTICFGPMFGKEPSFVLLDDWVPSSQRVRRERALGELVWRYFDGHGLATEQDIAWWAGLTLTEVREGIEAVRSRLTEQTHDGVIYYSGPSRAEIKDRPAHLLPGFDEYVIGYRDRSVLLDSEHTKEVLSSNGIFYSILVIDGRVHGTWKVRRSKRDFLIEVRPFSRLSPQDLRYLEDAATEYGNFKGLSASVTVAGASH
jgi:hypothetical protein